MKLAGALISLVVAFSPLGNMAAQAASNAPMTPLPNPVLTPGSSTSATAATICTSKYLKSSSRAMVSKEASSIVFAQYHISKKNEGHYVIDHLISTEIGGSNGISNLWPITVSGKQNAAAKDSVGAALRSSLCAGYITLAVAQHAIASNWTLIAINPYKPMPTTSVQWFLYTGSSASYFRVVAPVQNPGLLPLAGVKVSWTAYDNSGAIVGSYSRAIPEIGALASWNYVGGAGITLKGVPVRATVTITDAGNYVKTSAPVFPVDSVQFSISTFQNSPNATTYEVSGYVTVGGSAPVLSANLDIPIVLYGPSGSIVGGDFYYPTDLPATLSPGTRFRVDQIEVDATSNVTSASISASTVPG
jgi:hypothetical protein